MQLVAYGAQDIYLTGNPQITFFKVVYRRHTNFSMEAIQQTFNGQSSVNGSTMTSTISRNGDLVSNLWLDVILNLGALTTVPTYGAYMGYTNNTGHAFIKECEVEIGGQRIDRHYSQWLDVYNELTDKEECEWIGLNKHSSKNYLNAQTSPEAVPGGPDEESAPLDNLNKLQLYVPLKFWFCRNPGLALPLIALQYHEVKVKLVTRNIKGLINSNATLDGDAGRPTVTLWADYIYLDTDERRRFAQVSHEYLIEQVQRETSAGATGSKVMKLNFNHPVKELIWVVQKNSVATEVTAVDALRDSPSNNSVNQVNSNDYFCYLADTTSGTMETLSQMAYPEPFGKVKLVLNGHDRFKERNATYFRTCQPIQAGHRVPQKHIYNYSFALKPEEHQPSGTCNFSRIDNAALNFLTGTINDSTITVYAVNYNVLRIMSGMGGLAYSN